jgi:thiol-disulfide isomerase/thioredoxin
MKKYLLIYLFIIFGVPSFGETLNQKLEQLGFYVFPEGYGIIDFELLNLNGERIKLSDYHGKVVLLNFWATWCPPCRTEIPSLQRLYEEFEDEDFIILAVNLQEDKNWILSFMEGNKMSFPVLLDTNNKAWSLYGTSGIPTTYIIDKQGKMISRIIGGIDWYSAEILNIINILLTE